MAFNVDTLLMHPSFPQIAKGIKWCDPKRALDYGLINELAKVCADQGRTSPEAKRIRALAGIEEPRRHVRTGKIRMPVEVSPLEIKLLEATQDEGDYNTDDMCEFGFNRKSAQERARYLWHRGMMQRVRKMKTGQFVYRITDKGIHFLAERESQ